MKNIKKLIPYAVLILLAVAGYQAWKKIDTNELPPGLYSGNGRIEAVEIDVAAKLAGRIEEILVNEGDFVKAGEPLAHMQLDVLQAQRDEAMAQYQQALNTVAANKAQVTLRESDRLVTLAQVKQRESELDAAERRLKRSSTLSAEGASSLQELDDDQAKVQNARAALEASRAQVAAAVAAIEAAQAQVVGATSAATAAQATIARIEADINDSQL